MALVTDSDDLADLLGILDRIDTWTAPETGVPPPARLVAEAAAELGLWPDQPYLPVALPAPGRSARGQCATLPNPGRRTTVTVSRAGCAHPVSRTSITVRTTPALAAWVTLADVA
jgi:hypothetical protein